MGTNGEQSNVQKSSRVTNRFVFVFVICFVLFYFIIIYSGRRKVNRPHNSSDIAGDSKLLNLWKGRSTLLLII